MKIQPEVIKMLNEVLGQELIAINQYFLHAKMLKNWGLDELGEEIYKESIHCMKRANRIVERIFMLEGLPNLQNLGKLLVGQSTKEILECDFRTETDKHEILKKAIATMEENMDYVSRDTLEHMKDHNEEYMDWIGTQLRLMEQIGSENYHQTIAD